MERVSFNYSTKNTPVASKKEYISRQLVDKTEKFLSRMRWKAYHFLNPNQQSEKELSATKQEKTFQSLIMTKITQKVKFMNIECQFQKYLKSIKRGNRRL